MTSKNLFIFGLPYPVRGQPANSGGVIKRLDSYITCYLMVVDVAKPIEPTPVLYGEDAKRFIENMVKEQESPSPVRVAFIKEAIADSKRFIRK